MHYMQCCVKDRCTHTHTHTRTHARTHALLAEVVVNTPIVLVIATVTRLILSVLMLGLCT